MKKIFIFALIICASAMATSCGASKTLYGKGEGISVEKTVAEDKAKLHAFAEMTEKSNVNVAVNASETTVETESGITKKFTKTVSTNSNETFQNLDVKKMTYATANGYDSKVKVKGRTVKAKKDKYE